MKEQNERFPADLPSHRFRFPWWRRVDWAVVVAMVVICGLLGTCSVLTVQHVQQRIHDQYEQEHMP